MNAAERAALIARAKSLAIPVASCVAARLRPDHLLRDLTWEQLNALVIVLAEAADPVTLRVVTEATDDGPVVTDRDVTLRRAHAEAKRLREAGEQVPFGLRALDSEYRGTMLEKAQGNRTRPAARRGVEDAA